MSPTHQGRSTRARASHVTALLSAAALACVCLPAHATALSPSTVAARTSAVELDPADAYYPHPEIGFADHDRTGRERTQRNDLTGALGGRVDLIQATSSAPAGNAAALRPDAVAERATMLTFIPAAATDRVTLTVHRGAQVLGALSLSHPNRMPGIDQTLSRGTVGWSNRAWWAELPWQWMRAGIALTFTDADGRTGTTGPVELAAPVEMVINNIQLGMLTPAPDGDGQRFIKRPASGASDYFQTIPIARMTMARYEKVELDRVIIANGTIYTTASTGEGGVHSGDMRENVGKAQVSTGINLATWGITSSPMNQNQPQVTNQRVIHHSAGLYVNGRQIHGLSGGNGMATLHASVGNELSHELGHSYGLGHWPGIDTARTGDDIPRNATHHMDSGWGWISYRKVMRSNLDPGPYGAVRDVNGHPFGESLVGRYNFNRDTMSSGWDASPVSDYTHMTAYSLRNAQNSLRTVTADLDFPSGYRDWDASAGQWVDATHTNPSFNRPRPTRVGGSVFTLLGGYNPAVPSQSLLYPAFRSNYGVTFDLPRADPQAVSATRSCWVQVDFAARPTQYVAIGAGDGVKQLNINVAESDVPTGARVACRKDGVTTPMGDPITIATDLPPMAEPVVVGREAGFDILRAEELAALEPRLSALAGVANPVLSAADMLVLRGWSDDLTTLSPTALAVAERALRLVDDATDLSAWLAQHADRLGDAGTGAAATLTEFLTQRGHLDAAGAVLPAGRTVTVDGGKCLTLEENQAGTLVRVTTSKALCTGSSSEQWWVDSAGRIHPGDRPELCLRADTPVVLAPCAGGDDQRWSLEGDGHVVRASAPGTALDLNRSTHRPGLYGRTSGSNQIWSGLTTSENGLLGALDGAGLSALWAAPRPVVDVSSSTAAGASGWITEPSTASARARELFTRSALVAEVGAEVGADGGEWSTTPVVLVEGENVVRARATDSGGTTTAVRRTYRVDSVPPASVVEAGKVVRLTATDATSGVDRIEWRRGTGDWQVYSAPLTDLSGALYHRAIDVAGNVEAAHVVTLAPTPPGTSAKAATRTSLVLPRRITVGTHFVVRAKVRTTAGARVAGRVTITVRRGRTRCSPAPSRSPTERRGSGSADSPRRDRTP